MPLAQVLGDILGDVGNAAYNPQPNPAYGAVKVSPDDYVKHLKAAGINLPDNYQPPQSNMWLSPDGEDVTDHVNQGLSPNDPFIKPGFMAKLFSSNARDIQGRNAVAEAFPGQQAQALAAQQKAIYGTGQASTGSAIERAKTIGQQPANTIPFVAGVGGIDPNAMGTASDVMARGQAGTYPAAAEAATRQYGTIGAQNTPEAYGPIAQNAVREASTVQPFRQIGEEFQALYPGLGGPALNIGAIDPSTGVMGQVHNPVQSLPVSILDKSLDGGMTQGPSSAFYPVKHPQVAVPPMGLIGQSAPQQSSQPQQLAPFTPPVNKEGTSGAANVTPVRGTEFGFDKDSNVYYMPTGEYYAPEYYENTPVGKAIKHAMSLSKAVESDRKAAQLPHGFGYELGKAWHDSFGFNRGLIGPAAINLYHKTIRE